MSIVSSVDKTSLNKPLKLKTCTKKTKHAKSTTLKPTLGLRKIPKAKLSHHSHYNDIYKFLFNGFFLTSDFIVNTPASKTSIFLNGSKSSMELEPNQAWKSQKVEPAPGSIWQQSLPPVSGPSAAQCGPSHHSVSIHSSTFLPPLPHHPIP